MNISISISGVPQYLVGDLGSALLLGRLSLLEGQHGAVHALLQRFTVRDAGTKATQQRLPRHDSGAEIMSVTRN